MNRTVHLLAPAVLALGLCVLHTADAAEARGTAAEAQAMVKKAVAHLRAAGREQALKDFTEDKAAWTDRDLYVTVITMDGVTVAHGANKRQVGQNMLEFTDADGKQFFRERVELAKAKSSFSQDYKFSNPVSKKIEPKTMFCEKATDLVVCTGVYR